MTDENLAKIVDGEFETALGISGSELAAERALAYEYYNRERRGDEVDGESAVVSSAVADVVDGIMPSLLRLFTTQDNLVSFDAFGPEDEAAAEQESDYVSHIFFKRNPAFVLMFYWFFDALLQKNGITKAYWDDAERFTQEKYHGLSEDELLALASDEELEIVERSERTDVVIGPDGLPQPGIVHDVTFKRTTGDGYARVVNVPPDEYRISKDATSIDPSSARMVGHEREITRSELLEMGFDKKIVNELKASDQAARTPEGKARQTGTVGRINSTPDKSQDKILVREAYIKVDYDGDGKAELRQVYVANGKLLSHEVVDRQPFHVLCPVPLPHKHFGRSMADKVMDVQDIETHLTRQTLTNLYHSNRPSHAVWEMGMGETTLDDLLTTRTGSVKRFARPVNESYQTITVPFTAGASFQMLEHYEDVKRNRTGVNADSEGLSPESLKNIQTTVLSQATDQSKMKIEAVARIFAETGIKSLFMHLHELTQKHQDKMEVVKLRGEWVQVDPSAWKHRRDMTVNIGLGIGTKEQNLLHLESIFQKQAAIIQGGGMNLIVTPKNVFNTAKEIVKNAGHKVPELFFTDPGDKPAPPPADEQDELKKKELALQERQQQLDSERQQINAAKLQLQGQEQALKHQREMLKLQKDSETKFINMSLENQRLQGQLAKIQAELQSAAEMQPYEQAEKIAELEKLIAETRKIQAEAQKVAKEADAQGIENEATVSGITKLVNDLGGSEETE